MFSFEGATALRASEEVKVKSEESMCWRSQRIEIMSEGHTLFIHYSLFIIHLSEAINAPLAQLVRRPQACVPNTTAERHLVFG